MSIEIIEGRQRDLGGGTLVERILPYAKRRSVGGFVFLDHFGPMETTPDVRPHPHIHLATITYLFDGAIRHRDSLGSDQVIRPGAVNWMHAGRGIVHSERRPEGVGRQRVHGLQAWVALPVAHEDGDPFFRHVDADDLPRIERPGATIRLLVGQAYGERAPVETFSELVYLDLALEANASVVVPECAAERAVFVAKGALEVDGTVVGRGSLAMLDGDARVGATEDARAVILGGEPLGKRHMFWNFVSSDLTAIEEAKRDWREQNQERFPLVPGDEEERIPLP